MFLGKFCFISQEGRVKYKISYPVSYGVQNLLFYYDAEWPNVYPKKSRSCDAKEHELSYYRILNLTNPYSGCIIDKSNYLKQVIRCEAQRKFIGSRPRYWFMVISNCFPPGTVSISFYFYF